MDPGRAVGDLRAPWVTGYRADMVTKVLPPCLGVAERAALAELQAFVHERFAGRVADLRLFGSRARGEGHQFSDLDVLIAIDDLDTEERWAIWRFSGELMDRHRVTVGALALPTRRWRELQADGRLLAREIARDGVEL